MLTSATTVKVKQASHMTPITWLKVEKETQGKEEWVVITHADALKATE